MRLGPIPNQTLTKVPEIAMSYTRLGTNPEDDERFKAGRIRRCRCVGVGVLIRQISPQLATRNSALSAR